MHHDWHRLDRPILNCHLRQLRRPKFVAGIRKLQNTFSLFARDLRRVQVKYLSQILSDVPAVTFRLQSLKSVGVRVRT
ncbi:hypothetical protein ABIB10_005686 [Bradyrhizobium sp. RT3b]